MLCQRVLTRSFPLARVAADALVLIFALVLVWGGAMLVLLAFKASPDTINGLSGYHTAYDYLAGLEPRDVTASTRLIAAIGGLIACLIFGYLAWRAVPRPYLVRTDLRLASDVRGSIDVNARVIERAAEIAVLDHPAIIAARARYETDRMALDLSVRRARELPETLREAQRRVRAALADHDLPQLPVDVTLTGFDRQQQRELS